MIIVTLVPYDIIIFFFIFTCIFCQLVHISTFRFLQGRSLNPYFKRHIFVLLDNLYITSNRGRLAGLSKRAHATLVTVYFYVMCERSRSRWGAEQQNFSVS